MAQYTRQTLAWISFFLHKRKSLLGENCSHGLMPANTASQKSNLLHEFLRDNKRRRRRRRKSGDKILQTEAVWFRTPVFSLNNLASGNFYGNLYSQLCINICIKKFNSLQQGPKRTQGEKWVREKSGCSWDMCHLTAFLVLLDQLSGSAWFFLSLNRLVIYSKHLCTKFPLLFFPPTGIDLLINQIPSPSMTQVVL